MLFCNWWRRRESRRLLSMNRISPSCQPSMTCPYTSLPEHLSAQQMDGIVRQHIQRGAPFLLQRQPQHALYSIIGETKREQGHQRVVAPVQATCPSSGGLLERSSLLGAVVTSNIWQKSTITRPSFQGVGMHAE